MSQSIWTHGFVEDSDGSAGQMRFADPETGPRLVGPPERFAGKKKNMMQNADQESRAA